jgi:hypothetical protein
VTSRSIRPFEVRRARSGGRSPASDLAPAEYPDGTAESPDASEKRVVVRPRVKRKGGQFEQGGREHRDDGNRGDGNAVVTRPGDNSRG